MRSLSGPERDRALEAVATVALLQLNSIYSEEAAREKLKFGSVDAMRQQLRNWEVPDWLMPEGPQNGPKRRTPRSEGQEQEVPPLTNATTIFMGVIETLARFVELLPLRREHRQGPRFVASNAKPIIEPRKTGENYGYLETPPDVQPNEHGVVNYTLDQAYVRVPGGAARHPDRESTAMIAAALLLGISPDELLEALHPEPTDDVREQARILLEGDETQSRRRDSLENRAQDVATLIRGGAVGKGKHKRELLVRKVKQAAAWQIQEWRGSGIQDEEIAQRLDEDAAFLSELKRDHRITVKDVQDLGNLNLKPY